MFRLCLVTDRKNIGFGKNLNEAVLESVKGGIEAVILREKDLRSNELYETAVNLRKITKGKCLFLVNSRMDIAKAVSADGVHLNNRSLPIEAVRKVFDGIIGFSCHSVEDVKNAESAGADYVILGPVYYTSSKAKYGKPIGLEVLREARKKTGLHILAIGGIKQDNVSDVVSAGADGIAVVSGIIGSFDIKNSTKDYKDTIYGVLRKKKTHKS